MGIRLQKYGVHLPFFYQSVGSKNDKLQKDAVSYLLKNNLLNVGPESEFTVLYNGFLERVILKGTLIWRPTLLTGGTGTDWESVSNQEAIKANSIVAILAQASSFEDHDESGLRGQLALVGDLSFTPNLDYSTLCYRTLF